MTYCLRDKCLAENTKRGIIRALAPNQIGVDSCGAVAQLGERCVRNAEVGSSILLRSTNYTSSNIPEYP
jgi:hypothetical protein